MTTPDATSVDAVTARVARDAAGVGTPSPGTGALPGTPASAAVPAVPGAVPTAVPGAGGLGTSVPAPPATPSPDAITPVLPLSEALHAGAAGATPSAEVPGPGEVPTVGSAGTLPPNGATSTNVPGMPGTNVPSVPGMNGVPTAYAPPGGLTGTAAPTGTAPPTAATTPTIPSAPTPPPVPQVTPSVSAMTPTQPRPTQPAVPAGAGAAPGAFTPAAAREDVPVLHRTVNGHPLVWLDNAATTQKPRQVIEALAAYYSAANSNIHRGAHTMAREATEAYEGARAKVAEFLGAPAPESVVFTRGTTESVNLVAQSWGRANLGPGDDILVPVLEHHSDIVPWQQIAAERRARVVPVPLLPDGTIDQTAYADLLSNRTQLVAISQASNVLGTLSPVREMIALAHRYNAKVLVDGAQAVAHLPVDVTELDADFYAFSGHKIFGPTGIGALYAKPEILESMRPWQGGGNMIESVTFDRTDFMPPPHRFEAGTGHIGGAVGLGAALDWLTAMGREAVAAYEHQLMSYAQQALANVPGLEILGPLTDRVGVLTFTLPGRAPDEIAAWLDADGIAVRSGHHCAQPALAHYGLTSATRASLALYNTPEDLNQLTHSLHTLTQQQA